MKISYTFVLLSVLKILIEVSYLFFVHKHFEYNGFILEFSLVKYIFSWIVFFVGYKVLYLKRKQLLYEMYLTFFILYFLPTVVFFSFSNQNVLFLLILTSPYLAIVYFTLDWKMYNYQNIIYGKIIVLISAFILTSFVLANYYFSTDGNMVFNLYEVYDFREKYGNVSSIGIFGYLNSWVTKIFIVILLAWSIHRRKIILISLFIVVILFLFLLSGHKSVFQSLIIVLGFHVFFKFKKPHLVLLISFISLIVTTLLVSFVINMPIVSSMILRRLLFVPTHLNYTYLEFFSIHEYIYWSNGILKNIIEYPYEIKPVFLIGEYLGKDKMAANTGFIGNGFMHAGILGVFVYTIIAIILFNIINLLGSCFNKFFLYSIVFMPIFTLIISSDLLTTLLTHGLFISILVLFLFEAKTYILKYDKIKYKL